MTTITRTALVPYRAEQMYELVDDIEHYAEFLPWCESSEVMSRTDTEVRAGITLAKAGIRQRFATRNLLDPGRRIDIELIEGPFRHLQGHWLFEPLGDAGCKVSLRMEFEFSNPLVEKVFGPVFTRVVNTLMDAFMERAAGKYG